MIPSTRSRMTTQSPGLNEGFMRSKAFIMRGGEGSSGQYHPTAAAQFRIPNSEGRNPKEGRIPMAEATLEHFGFRVSAFFRPSDFGLRVWAFALGDARPPGTRHVRTSGPAPLLVAPAGLRAPRAGRRKGCRTG